MNAEFEQANEFLNLDNWLNGVSDSLSQSSTVMSNDDFTLNMDQFIMDSMDNSEPLNNYLLETDDPYSQSGTSTSCSSTDDMSVPNFAKPLLNFEEGPWTIPKIQSLINCFVNPVGKFLRDAHITAEMALRTNIMPFLIQVSANPNVTITTKLYAVTYRPHENLGANMVKERN